MKLKMSPNSLFAILLRSPWWISLLVVAVIALAARALLPEPYVGFGMLGGFPFFAIGMVAAWRQWRAPSPAKLAESIAAVAAMPWREFADALEQAFVQQGYVVTRLNHSAVDFRLTKGGHMMLVSCKRWKAATHGVDALRELVAAKKQERADQVHYISVGKVTESARIYAQDQGIHLIFGDELSQLLPAKSKT
jgi:restriction system protein